MTTDPIAPIASMLLADARLPTGGYAHSSTLEPAIVAGLTIDTVPDFLRTRMTTVALVEESAAVLTRRYADWRSADASQGSRHRPEPHRFSLADIQAALAARTPSQALRAASAQLGRGYTRLATRLYPNDAAVAELTELGREALRPVAFGVLAAALG